MNRLRELREQENLTQQEIATKLHISRQSYGFYENEQRALNPEILIKLADLYNVTIDYILYRTSICNNRQDIEFEVTPSEIELIKKYRALSGHGKEIVITLLEQQYNHEREKLKKSSNEITA